MRTSLLLAMLVLTTGLLSQPVLDSNDLPQGGTTYLRATAVPPLLPGDLDAGGADLTWDYSDLEVANETETEYFPMSTASLTTQFVFMGADHFTAFDLPDLGEDFALPISGATVYNEFGSGAYRTVGLGITTDIFDLPVIYDDEEEIVPLPLSYGAALEGSSAFEIDLPGVLYYATDQTMDIEVDAWGTLLLPSGSFECLRVKRNYAAEDTVHLAAAEFGFALPREGTVYEWYAQGEGMPVLSVQTFVDIPATWQFKPAESTTAVATPDLTDWLIQPTLLTSGSPFWIDGADSRHWTVFDLTGKVWFDGLAKTEGTRQRFETAKWPAGAYIVMDPKSGRKARVIIR